MEDGFKRQPWITTCAQCWKFPQVRRSEADNFGGGPGTFCWFFFNFMFMILDSRPEDLQLFWLSFKHCLCNIPWLFLTFLVTYVWHYVYSNIKEYFSVIIPPASTKLKGGVYWFHLVHLSVCGQNHVCSVSSTILVGSISHLHILSINFRRCVAYKVCLKIIKFRNFGKFFKFVTLTLSSFDLGSNMIH